MNKISWLKIAVITAAATYSAHGQCNLGDTIWKGYLTGKTKEVAHYQANTKGASITGATANQLPVEIWFPSNTNFCVVFNNSQARASAADGRNGVMVYDASLYDIVVGRNPAPANPMLTYWQGTGAVDLKKRRLTGTAQTEEDTAPVMSVVATYAYKKRGSQETLTVTGTGLLPNQSLDSLGDGWKLNPGVITYTGVFTKTTNKVSIEGAKQGEDGF